MATLRGAHSCSYRPKQQLQLPVCPEYTSVRCSWQKTPLLWSTGLSPSSCMVLDYLFLHFTHWYSESLFWVVWTTLANTEPPSSTSSTDHLCPLPSITHHGSVHTTGTIPGSCYHIECDHGYSLLGINNVMCESNGNWSSPLPLCGEKGGIKVFHTMQHIMLS